MALQREASHPFHDNERIARSPKGERAAVGILNLRLYPHETPVLQLCSTIALAFESGGNVVERLNVDLHGIW